MCCPGWPQYLLVFFLSLTRQLKICSHIGQSREKDIGHLSDIVMRRRTRLNVVISSPLNLSARQSFRVGLTVLRQHNSETYCLGC
jgi:hypothetical protein